MVKYNITIGNLVPSKGESKDNSQPNQKPQTIHSKDRQTTVHQYGENCISLEHAEGIHIGDVYSAD